MPLSKQKSYISIEDYLAGERDGELRHEYINGDVYAMVGASRNHNIITFNVGGLLYAGLKPPCQGYISDMKIHIQAEDNEWFYYPDAAVVCAEDSANDYYSERPVLIVEVISPSTERADKYEKRLNYQRLDSLQEYVLIHQNIQEVWVFRRYNQWAKEVYYQESIELPSIGVTMKLEDIYRNVRL